MGYVKILTSKVNGLNKKVRLMYCVLKSSTILKRCSFFFFDVKYSMLGLLRCTIHRIIRPNAFDVLYIEFSTYCIFRDRCMRPYYPQKVQLLTRLYFLYSFDDSGFWADVDDCSSWRSSDEIILFLYLHLMLLHLFLFCLLLLTREKEKLTRAETTIGLLGQDFIRLNCSFSSDIMR